MNIEIDHLTERVCYGVLWLIFACVAIGAITYCHVREMELQHAKTTK
jgi:hypothetical protein